MKQAKIQDFNIDNLFWGDSLNIWANQLARLPKPLQREKVARLCNHIFYGQSRLQGGYRSKYISDKELATQIQASVNQIQAKNIRMMMNEKLTTGKCAPLFATLAVVTPPPKTLKERILSFFTRN